MNGLRLGWLQFRIICARIQGHHLTLLLCVESRRSSLSINFYIECLLTKLTHGAIVDHFHILAPGLDSRRAFLESFEIEHGHLLNVHVSLVARNACPALASLWTDFVGLVMKAELVELLLVKIGQVANGAQSGMGRYILLHCS